MTDQEQLDEIYADIDALTDKVLDRLNNQSPIITGWTKLRVIKMFIDQIAEGSNKEFFEAEHEKIKKKIDALPKSEA